MSAASQLRTLARLAGVENPDGVTLVLSARKGVGARSERRGWRTATARGWHISYNCDRNGDGPTDDAAVDALLASARRSVAYHREGLPKRAAEARARAERILADAEAVAARERARADGYDAEGRAVDEALAAYDAAHPEVARG